MKILALEFSSPQRSVAVVEAEPTKGPSGSSSIERASIKLSEVIETGGIGATLMRMIDGALGQAQIEREQIECLAVGLGPGSYNGIRQSIAMAQGWQLAAGDRGLKLLGLSSAECLAAQAHQEGIQGTVNVVIDAQRGEFYLAAYEINDKGWRTIKDLCLVGKREIEQCQAGGARVLSPGIPGGLLPDHPVFPRASTLGRLALYREDFLSGEKLEPIYLRETAFVKAPPPRVL